MEDYFVCDTCKKADGIEKLHIQYKCKCGFCFQHCYCKTHLYVERQFTKWLLQQPGAREMLFEVISVLPSQVMYGFDATSMERYNRRVFYTKEDSAIMNENDNNKDREGGGSQDDAGIL